MGASQSTPNADSTKHVFTSDTPINFSSELIDSLQNSPETNSTRAKTLDLHIAERVAAELEKLQAKEQSALQAAREKISQAEDAAEGLVEKAKDKLPSLPSVPGLLPSQGGEEKTDTETGGKKGSSSATSQKVQAEIEKLRSTLGQRKVLNKLPNDVDVARRGVIDCLRVNDRRALDCWKEVEVFKMEVKKLEDEFVSKIL